MPDPARPKCVLAPYWTDLNPADGGDIYFADVSYGPGLDYTSSSSSGTRYRRISVPLNRLWTGPSSFGWRQTVTGEDTSFAVLHHPQLDAVD